MKTKYILVGLFLVFILVAGVGIFEYLNSTSALPLAVYFGSSVITVHNSSGNYSAEVFIAGSLWQQTTGMMFRQNFEGEYGMLFDNFTTEPLCFWMENTQIPLKQSWINASGYVTAVYQGQPYNTSAVCNYGTYVLETLPNARIGIGDKVTFSN